MNAAPALCLRHPLYPVNAAFIFQFGVGALSSDHGDHFLESADAVFIYIDDLHLPVAALRVVYIHAVKLCGKQGGLISPRAGPDLQDDVLVVIWVLGKKKDL